MPNMTTASQRRRMTHKPYIIKIRAELKDLGTSTVTFYGWPTPLPETEENKDKIQIARNKIVVNNEIFLGDPIIFDKSKLLEIRRMK